MHRPKISIKLKLNNNLLQEMNLKVHQFVLIELGVQHLSRRQCLLLLLLEVLQPLNSILKLGLHDLHDVLT